MSESPIQIGEAIVLNNYPDSDVIHIVVESSGVSVTVSRDEDSETYVYVSDDAGSLAQTFRLGTDEVITHTPDAEEPCDHKPDWATIYLADGTTRTMDVVCVFCGASGSFDAKPEDIQW